MQSFGEVIDELEGSNLYFGDGMLHLKTDEVTVALAEQWWRQFQWQTCTHPGEAVSSGVEFGLNKQSPDEFVSC